MSNVDVFRNHIHKLEVFMEEIKLESGEIGFRTEETIKGGGNVIFGVVFNELETIIDINVWGLAEINNPMKKEDLHSLLNTLNKDFRFATFTEDNGQVHVGYSLMIDEDFFDPQRVIRHYVMILNCLETVYPRFMRLQWA